MTVASAQRCGHLPTVSYRLSNNFGNMNKTYRMNQWCEPSRSSGTNPSGKPREPGHLRGGLPGASSAGTLERDGRSAGSADDHQPQRRRLTAFLTSPDLFGRRTHCGQDPGEHLRPEARIELRAQQPVHASHVRVRAARGLLTHDRLAFQPGAPLQKLGVCHARERRHDEQVVR